jgi:putative membrane protein
MVCVAALTVGCNRNQRADVRANNDTGAVGTTGENASNVSAGDRDWINDMAADGMAEVELGKLAADHGLSADVKKFGQMMVTDHTKGNDELKQVASRFNIAPPPGMDDKHRDLYEKLSKLQGNDFDKQYMDAMVDGHEHAVDKLDDRVDGKTLSDWKTKVDNLPASARGTEQGIVTGVQPEHSDNPATMAINQFAANTLPTVRMHLDSARMIKDKVNERGRNATK